MSETYHPFEATTFEQAVQKNQLNALCDSLILDDPREFAAAAYELQQADTPFRQDLLGLSVIYGDSMIMQQYTPPRDVIDTTLRAVAFSSTPVELTAAPLVIERYSLSPQYVRRLLMPNHTLITRIIDGCGKNGLSKHEKDLLSIRGYVAMEALGVATFMDKLYHRVLVRRSGFKDLPPSY